MTTVYIIRHALAEGNLYRRCHGWYNSLITAQGYKQIDALRERFRDIHIDAVYSSDLYRTMTTAQAICRPHNLPLHLSSDLREIGMGIWEDLPWGEALNRDPDCMAAFLRCDPNWYLEGSDTFPGAQDRFCGAVERFARNHPDQTIACFAHGAVIRTAFARWMGLPPERIGEVPLGNNTCVSCLEIDGGRVSIRCYADDSHLSPAIDMMHRTSSGSGFERMRNSSVFFRPFDPEAQSDLYLSWRADGWMASHGTMDGFDGSSFLAAARQNHTHKAGSIQIAYINGIPVGMLQMDWSQESSDGVGRVPFLYVCPEYRSRGVGAQLLGEAIYAFRKAGRDRLRLRCAPENDRAKAFYRRLGFRKIGEEAGGIGHLDTLELYIGIQLG